MNLLAWSTKLVFIRLVEICSRGILDNANRGKNAETSRQLPLSDVYPELIKLIPPEWMNARVVGETRIFESRKICGIVDFFLCFTRWWNVVFSMHLDSLSLSVTGVHSPSCLLVVTGIFSLLAKVKSEFVSFCTNLYNIKGSDSWSFSNQLLSWESPAVFQTLMKGALRKSLT